MCTQRVFSTASETKKDPTEGLSVKEQHLKVHSMDLMDEKFFENDYIMTATDEIEFIRSPLYEISKAHKMSY